MTLTKTCLQVEIKKKLIITLSNYYAMCFAWNIYMNKDETLTENYHDHLAFLAWSAHTQTAFSGTKNAVFSFSRGRSKKEDFG